MPTITGTTNDGNIDSGNQSSHANARGATTGTAVTNDTIDSQGIRYFRTSARGSTTVAIARSFLYFDTSGITSTVSSATLKIVLNTVNSATVIAVRGTQSTSLVDGNFDEVDFSVPYSGEITPGGSSGYTSITLNSDALSRLVSEDTFKVALLEHDHDFQNSEPSDTSKTVTVTYADNSVNKPQIEYALATSGYSHDINALAAASISKVNTVATANIGKINALD